ncbi:hypothetical protein [Paenibacillus xylanexedens]|uniref:hypothetical protein n=2 Tax=Paenibacillus TaxID=44249 RepID=UPI003CFC1172
MVKRFMVMLSALLLVASLFGTAFVSADSVNADSVKVITEENLQRAITEGSSQQPIASIEVSSQEEADRIIKKIESIEPIDVEVYRQSDNISTDNVSPQAVQVAKVRTQPTYTYYQKYGVTGNIEVYLKIWVEGGDIATWISSVKGYAAAATNAEGVRMNINYINFLPLKTVNITEESDIKINFDTSMIMVEGYATVKLTGGWSNADVFFDWEHYF